ncbi:SagB/ThcOx family dehydrogenase [Kocuria sp.]|uniref:SagB/ThcOx family dehydrogenase n=1 Tax=Kocuria sp. TaxID=1871328 RepID=UPI0026DEE8AE|nr:SagB/ThcOx family dehydrogenase [Kocuria sp.]MDO5619150.1 SagB/ThcOx family dehydrogenase [Kocuria sp.]
MQYDSTNLEDVVYPDGVPSDSDASECFLEASKISKATLRTDLPGMERLQSSEALRRMTLRAGRRYTLRPSVPLPEPDLRTQDTFQNIVLRRKSADEFGRSPLTVQALANVLHHSYRVIYRTGSIVGFRPTPSAGALYPLDVFFLTLNCADPLPTERCLYYDPFRHDLADLGHADRHDIVNAYGDDALVSDAGIIIVITAMFARSRIKYGQRGARFCYLEAGHLAQSIALAAEASGLQCRIWGGFFDDPVTALIPGLDGVDSAPLHSVVLGTAT